MEQYYLLTPDGSKIKLDIASMEYNTVNPHSVMSFTMDASVTEVQHPTVGMFGGYINKDNYITRVIVNKPAVIVFWNDGTKTVVKCSKEDHFDAEKGVLLAVLKRIQGNPWVAKLLQDWCPVQHSWYDIQLSDVRRKYRGTKCK